MINEKTLVKIEIQPLVDEILRLGIEEFESMNVKDLKRLVGGTAK